MVRRVVLVASHGSSRQPGVVLDENTLEGLRNIQQPGIPNIIRTSIVVVAVVLAIVTVEIAQ